MILKIYLEGKKDKTLVGTLERKNGEYIFNYDEKYYYSEAPLQIGPELSLKKRVHKSKELFSIFSDRIPSKKNAAYEEYCREVGIDKNEKDEMILLAKLGARGPSSLTSIQRVENGKAEGSEVLKRIEIYAKFRHL